jgi:molecular chaperone GrpE
MKNTKDQDNQTEEVAAEETVEQSEAAEAQPVSELDAVKAEYEAKIAELINDLQRTRADFENYRRAVEQQREIYGETVKESTVKKILPLLDNIDRAIVAQPEAMGPLEKGFNKTLKELKLEKIVPAVGDEFNPDVHNAVMVEGDGEEETIAEVLQPGYLYEGQLVREVLVKVAKN